MPRINSKKERTFLVKIAGGATAQCLGLMSAIYLKKKTGNSFVIKHYPYSTGTYWPFALNFLLNEDELLNDQGLTRGLEAVTDLQVGKVIKGHPLSQKSFTYEKFLAYVRKLGLEEVLQRLRGEWALMSSTKKLLMVRSGARTISGGFPPLLDQDVSKEIDFRFKRAGKKSPFSSQEVESKEDYAVLHLRLGDKRHSFSNPADFGGDGIIDPLVFKEILNTIAPIKNLKVYIVSDDPMLAKKLLEEVNLDAEINPNPGDIWQDLYFMSQAKVFIGSWSQVSQLAAVCVLSNGGIAYYPATTHNQRQITWSLEGLNFYEPKFLPKSHPVYI